MTIRNGGSRVAARTPANLRGDAWTERRTAMLPRRHSLFALIAIGLAGLASAATVASAQNAPIIAAASDLKFALEEIAAKFQADTKK